MKNIFSNQTSNQRHWRVLPKLSVAPVIALLLIMAAVLPGNPRRRPRVISNGASHSSALSSNIRGRC